jgi:hypothetical protein
MDDLIKIFGASAAQIGHALHALGWRRYRVWGPGPYRRFWAAEPKATAHGAEVREPAATGTELGTRAEAEG